VSRPRKTQRDVLADYSDGRAGQIYRDWHAFYVNAALPHFGNSKAASGSASRMMAHKYHLTARQIKNILDRGDALMRTLEVQGRTRAETQERRLAAFRETHTAIYAAAALLRKPGYKDLLEGCAMIAYAKPPIPRALREFSSAPNATAPDSLQHFAGVLARALLRAHEITEREIPAYAERKPPRRR
jgi:hypothetical protein